MAVRLHERRRIERPRPQVFAYVADFSNIGDWDPGVVSSARLDGDGPIQVGSRFELQVRFGSGTMPMTYEITALERDRQVTLVGRGERLEAVDVITLEDDDGEATVVDYVADLSFRGSLRLVSPLFRPALRQVGRKAVDGLKEALER